MLRIVLATEAPSRRRCCRTRSCDGASRRAMPHGPGMIGGRAYRRRNVGPGSRRVTSPGRSWPAGRDRRRTAATSRPAVTAAVWPGAWLPISSPSTPVRTPLPRRSPRPSGTGTGRRCRRIPSGRTAGTCTPTWRGWPGRPAPIRTRSPARSGPRPPSPPGVGTCWPSGARLPPSTRRWPPSPCSTNTAPACG